jgi:hypothetical protein
VGKYYPGIPSVEYGHLEEPDRIQLAIRRCFMAWYREKFPPEAATGALLEGGLIDEFLRRRVDDLMARPRGSYCKVGLSLDRSDRIFQQQDCLAFK